RHEQRHGRDQDRGERRADVHLAEAEQRPRHGHLDRGEHGEDPPPLAQPAQGSELPGDRQQDRRGEREPRPRDHARRELVDGDLDEQVGNSPDHRGGREQRPAARAQARALNSAAVTAATRTTTSSGALRTMAIPAARRPAARSSSTRSSSLAKACVATSAANTAGASRSTTRAVDCGTSRPPASRGPLALMAIVATPTTSTHNQTTFTSAPPGRAARLPDAPP